MNSAAYQQKREASKKRCELHLFCWFLALLFLHPALSDADTGLPQLHGYIDNGAYAVKFDGNIIHSHNLNGLFIPASTIKILTSLMALETFGPGYRCKTIFFRDEQNNLYVKGEGDPLLTSEAVQEIAGRLLDRNIQEIEQLILDDSAFALEGPPPGSANSHNPYDANSGALAVNFNALPFTVGEKNTVTSGEAQTPYLPLMKELAQNMSKGRYRVNVDAYPSAGPHPNRLRYTGELFIEVFKRNGITINNGYVPGKTPAQCIHLFTHASDKTIEDLVRLTLYYSNNFIANQLFLLCGMKLFGQPASWEKSRKFADKFIKEQLHVPPGSVKMEDGSGLSMQNQISPRAMLTVLDQFTPYSDLLTKREDVLFKSGTLTGVYSYAGYLTKAGTLVPFVLFLNQKRNTRKTILQIMNKEIQSLSAGS